MTDLGVSGRTESPVARLARLGFHEPARAAERLAAPTLARVWGSDAALDAIAAAADPDLALRSLAAVADLRTPEAAALVDAVVDDEAVRARLTSVLGVSDALGDHLHRHPEHWRVLTAAEGWDAPPTADDVRGDLLRAVGADPESAEPVAAAGGVEALVELRVAYRRHLLALAAHDVTGDDPVAAGLPVDEVAARLADLADAALEAGLAIARADLPPDAEPCRLAVIGMGKCGGRELNYVSDVDVVFVAEAVPGGDEAAALRTATRLATGMIRACGAPSPEGALWEVDAALRPEGKQGALVRTLASHVGYYERWAKTWEFQALLKARPSAGDRGLGAAYVDAVAPFVWSAADRDGFVDDVQAMRRRVEEHIPSKDVDRQLKLGPGGLRDVEFAVQLLQLVHGRSDVYLRSPTTLVALESLATWGYVGREDAATMGSAYRFLRTLEHRIQLYRLRRTQIVPDDEGDLRRIGRSLGFRVDPVAELTAEWRRHAREVRRLHEKLFYRPLLHAVARLDAGEARLTPEAARDRLEALGYSDPAGALRHLEALTAGVSRRAAIQRTLLPVMLGWFADSPDPDAGLLGFRRVSEALGSTHWYLRLLRDQSVAAERMAHVLGSSRYATDLLLRAPESVSMLADTDELSPRTADQLHAEVAAAADRHDAPELYVRALRALRRRELLRISVADVLGLLDVDQVSEALTDVAAVTLAGALDAASRSVEADLGGPLPTRMCVIAMGRFGGGELGYGSDADVMFVHDPYDGVEEKAASDAAHRVANELRRLLMVPSTDPPLEVDAGLRPEGKQGPLVRTLASYAAYYARWSSPWEAQALLRAAPVAGDADVGARFVTVIDPLRYPAAGLDATALREMRRLKARMESERLPRGADPALHTKLGRGGLSDVEWVAQLLQLRHGAEVPGLRTTRTTAALHAAVESGELDADDAATLVTAWRTATRVRNATMLVRGRASDSVPTAARDLAGVSRVLGYPPGDSGRLIDDYRRVTRRARAVVERVFYDS